jgi:hypothetical protein
MSIGRSHTHSVDHQLSWPRRASLLGISEQQRREPGCPARELGDELRGRDTSQGLIIG